MRVIVYMLEFVCAYQTIVLDAVLYMVLPIADARVVVSLFIDA